MTVLHVCNGHVLVGEAVVDQAWLTLAGENVAAIDLTAPDASVDATIDLAGGWLAPGFIDVQVNGGGGVLFNDTPTAQGIAAIGAAHRAFGTTAFLPTLISDGPDVIVKALDALDAAMEAGVPGLVGIHVEGPFLNPRRKGIHSEHKLCRLDPAMLEVLCAPRRARVMLTLAPELADPADLDRLAAAGVLLSAGHSDATEEEARRGFAHGITGVTHLFNAMSPLLHRAPGMVGTALDSDDVWCGIIVDGVHVAPTALRLALRAKGPEKLMLVTDAMPGVGNGGKPFRLDGREIFVRDGICTDAAGTLAGSGLDMATAVRNTVAMGKVDPAVAIGMASASPAAFLGLAHERGSLEAGKRADFVVLDAGLTAVQTWIGGQRLFG